MSLTDARRTEIDQLLRGLGYADYKWIDSYPPNAVAMVITPAAAAATMEIRKLPERTCSR